MAVRPRGNSWQVDVTERIEGDKVRVRETVITSQEDAEALEAQIRATLKKGQRWDRAQAEGYGGTVQRSHTLQDLADLTWSRYWAHGKSGMKMWHQAQTVLDMMGAETPANTVTVESIDKLIFSLQRNGLANSTINRKLAALSKMLTVAQDRQWISRKPKIEKLKEGVGRVRFFSKEEQQTILSYFQRVGDPDMHDFTLIALKSGFRLSELVQIEGRDLDGAQLSTWETKSDSPRTIQLTKRAAEVLNARKDEHGRGRLFPELWKDRVEYRWTRMRTHTGLDEDKQTVFHTCRHTTASELAQAGVDLLEIKRTLGHKSIQTTMRYAHLGPKLNDQVVAALED